MTLLRRFFLIIALVLFAGAGIGALLPSRWTVTTSIHIDASPETVHGYIADLKRWREWTGATPEADPSAVWTYEGTPLAAGSSMHWQGDRTGLGKLVITEADPSKGMAYTLNLQDQFDGHGRFEYLAQDGGTLVTWTDVGDMGSALPPRYFLLLSKKKLETNFASKLGELKTLVENEAKGIVERPVDPVDELMLPPPKAEESEALVGDGE